MMFNMPPKYIGFFSKKDKNGKLQWKIIPCETSEEIRTAVEIMRQSGYTAETGFQFKPKYQGYMKYD